MFTVQQILEKHREFNKEIHLTFRDYEKPFDTIQRNLLGAIMERRGIPKHLLTCIKASYNGTNIVLELTRGILSSDIPKIKGLMQGYNLSPTLFNFYIDELVRHWELKLQKAVNTRFLSTLLFVGDQVLIQETDKDLQQAVHHLQTLCSDYGFKISTKKN